MFCALALQPIVYERSFGRQDDLTVSPVRRIVASHYYPVPSGEGENPTLARTAAASAARKARYKAVIDAGFSSAIARQLRDQKPQTQETTIQKEASRIAMVPAATRTKTDNQNYTAFLTTRRTRERDRQQNARQRSEKRDAARKASRIEQWRVWSANKSFPDDMIDYAENLNDKNGYDPNDSFGYLVQYKRYIDGENEAAALDFANHYQTEN